MSELESTLQQHCLAALDCLLFSSLKLGLALHRELITVFSKTKNTVICNLSSFKNTLVGTCPLQPASNINILLPSRYTASTSMYKYITKYLMLFFFFFPSSFQSPEQGVLRVQLSCPGTDSNFWRCTALGSSDPELLWQSLSSLLHLSTRKQKVLQFSTVINTSLPMENCVSNFFYTQPNLDKWKGQQCRH